MCDFQTFEKKYMSKSAIKFIALVLVFCSCNMNSPVDYFSRAALNCNLMYGFAGNVFHRQLAEPSVKLVDEKTMKTEPMKRTEFVQNKITSIEESFEKVKALGDDKEAADMIKASKEIHEFVLPVYKNEYMQVAKLYDDGADKLKIEEAENQIIQKYQTRFLDLYDKLWAAGKAYAAKNGITVRETNPSPGNY